LDFAEQCRDMVDRQLKARGISDPRVLKAMLEIPREEFVPPEARAFSYYDEPVSIGGGQTISQPYMTALMSQCLELTGSETVLDVGGGSGYHAAVLGALAARVYSIELISDLAEQARRNLERIGRLHNIVVICGDGSRGLPEHAPYDGISVAAAAPDVPRELLDQLKDPGKLVIPVGSIWDQELWVIIKSHGEIHKSIATYCRFVPLRGSEGWK